MLKKNYRAMLLGLWFVAVVAIASWSVALGATLSTSIVLFVLGIAPALVMLFIGFGEPPPTVAELLYAVDTGKSR